MTTDPSGPLSAAAMGGDAADTEDGLPASLSGVFASLFSGNGPAPRPTALEPLDMFTAGERIADRLVTAIALGTFVPGQRLPSERGMAAMLGVSRASVREALQRLAAEGYVEVRRGRSGGAYVTADWLPSSTEKVRRTLLPSWRALEDLLDCRSCVEEMIATVAARRRTDEDADAVDSALASYRDAGDDRELSRAADVALHGAVARATHSPYLIQLSEHLRQAVSLGFDAEPYTTSLRHTALDQHAQLARAVIEGRPPQAGEIAARHFTLTEGRIRDLVARIRPDEPSAEPVRPDEPSAGAADRITRPEPPAARPSAG